MFLLCQLIRNKMSTVTNHNTIFDKTWIGLSTFSQLPGTVKFSEVVENKTKLVYCKLRAGDYIKDGANHQRSGLQKVSFFSSGAVPAEN